MSDFRIFTREGIQSVTNTQINDSVLVKDSQTLYPKIKTLIEGDGITFTNTDNSVKISTISSTLGTLRGIRTGLQYANQVVSDTGTAT